MGKEKKGLDESLDDLIRKWGIDNQAIRFVSTAVLYLYKKTVKPCIT